MTSQQRVVVQTQDSPRVGGKLVLRTNPYYIYGGHETCSTNNVDWYTSFPDISWWTQDVRNKVNNPTASPAYKAAYDKFMQSFYENSRGLFAVDLIQRGQTVNMCFDTIQSIANGMVALRRKDPKALIAALGINSKRGKKRAKRIVRDTSKSSAQKWLALQYGWLPLYGSVYTGVNIICGDFSSRYIRKSAWAHTTSNFSFLSARGGYGGSITYKDVVVFFGEISVTNQTLFRLNQMGLLNPLEVLWDSVPFSFVFDWFIGVSDRLHAMTDFVGVTMTNGGYGISCKVISSSLSHFGYQATGKPRQVLSSPTVRMFGYNRNPSAAFRPPALQVTLEVPGIKRLASAVSLFITRKFS